ncbi:MAG: 16S rRNA (cytosine(1402)-N(4))-methyltransferase RsmH [bacterium]
MMVGEDILDSPGCGVMDRGEAIRHIPVLLEEVTALLLGGRPDFEVFVDCTLGGGGHSREILRRSGARVLGIDCDPHAIDVARKALGDFGDRATIALGDFVDIEEIVRKFGIRSADGVLMDLGVSSFQLDDPRRGFSHRFDSPLDMRMGEGEVTAGDLVNGLSEAELSDLISRYGEERYARAIAREIVRRRPIETTGGLVKAIEAAVPPSRCRRGSHPAARTFQALRIAVNRELEKLPQALDSAFEILKVGGRLVVISFHSLEDRMVKDKFKSWEGVCTCPKSLPICVCGAEERRVGRILTRRVIRPTDEEVARNPRARSARLRAIERVRYRDREDEKVSGIER